MPENIFHEQIQYPAEQSFVVKYNDIPHFTFPWHFHDEFEIVYVIQSTGRRFAGDSYQSFGPFDLSLMGPNLPHCYISDKEYFKNQSELKVNAYIIQFPSDLFSFRMLNSPEFKKIKILLQNSGRGMAFKNLENIKILKIIEELYILNGVEKYLKFIQLLHFLSTEEYEYLASEGYVNINPWPENSRLSKIYQYTMQQYRQTITMSEAANIAAMSQSAFCRFFKEKTRQTYKEFVIDLRVSYACKLLISGEENIAKVCFESGFTNLSNFNRLFKKNIGMTPTQYFGMHNKNLHIKPYQAS